MSDTNQLINRLLWHAAAMSNAVDHHGPDVDGAALMREAARQIGMMDTLCDGASNRIDGLMQQPVSVEYQRAFNSKCLQIDQLTADLRRAVLRADDVIENNNKKHTKIIELQGVIRNLLQERNKSIEEVHKAT